MFSIPVLLFITVIMSIVQISIWQMFPKKLRAIMFANPIFAFLMNLAGSGLISAFTGVASIVGICNLGASVVFGLYAWIYKEQKGIKGLGLDWYKLWNFIPIFPRLVVCYELNGKKWKE
jgi:hypothetical protein